MVMVVVVLLLISIIVVVGGDGGGGGGGGAAQNSNQTYNNNCSTTGVCVIKGRGMCYPLCGMMYIKEPVLLFGKSSPCGGSGCPLSLL